MHGIKNLLKIAALLLVAGLLQISLADLWLPLGAVDLLMIASGLLALRLPFVPTIFTGAAAGLVQDSLAGGLIGLHAFAKTAVTAGLNSLGHFLVVRGELASAVVIGLAAMVESIIVRLLLSFLQWPGDPSPLWLIGRGLGTTLACGFFLIAGPRVVMMTQRRRRSPGIRLR